MRHDEAGLVYRAISVENQIQIKCSRRSGKRTLAAERSFDAEKGIEQLAGTKPGYTRNRSVEEARLRSNSDRFGIVKAGRLHVVNVGTKRCDRLGEDSVAIALVTAQCDRDA